MLHQRFSQFACLLLLPLSLTQAVAEQVFTQSNTVPQLVELYTSQGCSSCPPADKKFNQLLDDPGLWKQRIPVAFHVDYWDYLGWKDPFANALNSQRQYQLKKTGAISNVYTPGWVVDGKEWRGFFIGKALPNVAEKGASTLTARLSEDRHVSVHYPKEDQLVANIAVLSFDLTSAVTAGENKDKTLQNQFVVTYFNQALSSNNWTFSLPERNTEREAIAIWLTYPYSAEPVQAVAGWLE